MNKRVFGLLIIAGLAVAVLSILSTLKDTEENAPANSADLERPLRNEAVNLKRPNRTGPALQPQIDRVDQAVPAVSHELVEAINSAFEEKLNILRIAPEKDAKSIHQSRFGVGTIWLDDRITSQLYEQVNDEDFQGTVPDFLYDAVDRSNTIELPSSWKPENLQDAVLQPLERLALSRGYHLEITPEGKLEGLSIDLLNHQRKYLVDYARLISLQKLRTFIITDEASKADIPASGVDKIIELDSTLKDLRETMDEMNSEYIQEFLRLVPPTK